MRRWRGSTTRVGSSARNRPAPGYCSSWWAPTPGHRGPWIDCGAGHHAEFVGYRDKNIDTVLGRITVHRAYDHDLVAQTTTWGAELRERPGVHVAGSTAEVMSIVEDLLDDHHRDEMGTSWHHWQACRARVDRRNGRRSGRRGRAAARQPGRRLTCATSSASPSSRAAPAARRSRDTNCAIAAYATARPARLPTSWCRWFTASSANSRDFCCYKGDVSGRVRSQHARVVRRLLYVGIARRQRCIEKVVGQRVSARVAVASLNRRPGVHPFVALAAAMNSVGDDLALTLAAGATSARTVSATQFEVHSPAPLTGHHILVLDDTWTTGSRAQTAALTLRAAGAAHISVIVVDGGSPPHSAATPNSPRPACSATSTPPSARYRWHLPVT